MRPPNSAADAALVEGALSGLLDEFFSSSDVSVDWRTVLNDESIDVTLGQEATGQVEIFEVCFVVDRVSQIAPLKPFNSVRCASVLRRALSGGE